MDLQVPATTSPVAQQMRDLLVGVVCFEIRRTGDGSFRIISDRFEATSGADPLLFEAGWPISVAIASKSTGSSRRQRVGSRKSSRSKPVVDAVSQPECSRFAVGGVNKAACALSFHVRLYRWPNSMAGSI
jgi:hypothetical protein